MTDKPDKFADPFSAGQLVGILVILTFIEQNQGIHKDFLEKLKATCAEKSAAYLDRPTEDVMLFVDGLIKEIIK